MEIKEFFRSNPLIKPSAIEKALGIPHGTIRLNTERKIPARYEAMIIESLSRYDAVKYHVVVNQEIVPLMPVKTAFEPAGRKLIVKRVTKVGIGEHAYIFGKMNGKLFERDNDIQDGAVVVI